MTQLAELLTKIIRERGDYFSTNNKEAFNWLEEKAKEVRKMVYREIRQDIKIDLMMLAQGIDSEPIPKDIQKDIDKEFLDMIMNWWESKCKLLP